MSNNRKNQRSYDWIYYYVYIIDYSSGVGVESLCKLALENFSRAGEANVVRAAAASLLTIATARTSPQTQVSLHNFVYL